MNPQQLEQAVERLNDLAQSVRRELRFSLHDETGRTVITVRDTETEEVIRQIPSDEVLALITRLENSESSLMKDEIV